MLIRGPSGVGKTECAAGLLTRGHRFVADDVVVVGREKTALVARPDAKLGSRAHIRDLGIIDMGTLFGEAQASVKLGCVVNLETVRPGITHPACGTEPGEVKILEITLPCYTIVAFPGRDLPLLVELAARRGLHG